jgi:hypothetical protein
MARLNFHPGGSPDVPDKRDHAYVPSLRRLPKRVDLSSFCGRAYQQYHTQSCSANALAAALTLHAKQLGVPLAPPSRLFMFYNARLRAGTQRTDQGVTIRDAIKALVRDGTCPEKRWPFRLDLVPKRPPRACYRDATILPLRYHRIRRDLHALRAALADGHAFIFGIQAYGQPFTVADRTHRLALPKRSDTLCGGHAMIAVGYDMTKKAFLARNSMGASYARNGFLWIPDAYFEREALTYDFWVIGGSTGW